MFAISFEVEYALIPLKLPILISLALIFFASILLTVALMAFTTLALILSVAILPAVILLAFKSGILATLNVPLLASTALAWRVPAIIFPP